MNKILSRKMFRQKYLESQKPSGFQKGGVAEANLDISDEELEKELNIEKTEPKVEPEVESTEPKSFTEGVSKILSLDNNTGGLTRNQKLQSYLAPIAAALLTGDQRAGEGKGAGTLRALGLGLAQIPTTIAAINKSDLEARAKKEEQDAAVAEGNTREVSIEEARRLGVNLKGVVSPGDIGTIQITYDPVTKTSSVSGKSNLSVKGTDQVDRLRKLVDKYDRKFISGYNSLVEEVDKLIMKNAEYDENGTLIGYNIPGQGIIQSPQLSGADAKALEGKIINLIDLIARERSGATITDQEAERFRTMLGVTGFRGDVDLVKALYDIGQMANKTLNASKAGFSSEVVNTFFGDENFASPKSKLLEKFLPGGLKDVTSFSTSDIDEIAGGD